ncbi:RNA 2',3'-cyclic phosphodiesterase [Breznakiella homolactica]|uniref:RNA 2',3'-cyclic phosphodiesterase n=1 Tax=Breznakiella homolactica TaxID=2798577 RepID=A0A7T7XJL5_9SPIR|nr:RNA 2',3'-cyclic phosphodiesterase [Breznakiella homolactica]QQO07422.1 RNA 2',3'-cyclic phosphodiesterase [Breznakiella homolactica]
MRVFAALPIPDDTRRGLTDFLSSLRRNHPDFRWVSPENLHITLAFLGELDTFGLSLVEAAVSALAADASPPAIQFLGLKTFPAKREPSVLAVEIGKGADELADLAADLESRLARAGAAAGYSFRAAPERRFTPHVTVARRGRSRLLLSPDDTDRIFSGEALLGRVCVFSSELRRRGAVYTELTGCVFTGTGDTLP